jgi:predicted permease
MEDQLEKELRFHVDQHSADLIAHGYDPETARREARLVLGGPEQVKEACRDARGTLWLEDLLQDFRYALRTLRQRPGFAVVALCPLALGTGATTIMFTLINGVLLKPLPYPDPERVVEVHGHTATWNAQLYGEQNLAYPDFLDCQRQSRSLSLAGFFHGGGTVSAPGEPQYVEDFEISSNFFEVLGVRMLHGRDFLPEEDRRGGAPVVIVSSAYWHQQLAGNLKAIGSRLVFDDKPYTVVGVAPSGIAPSNFVLDGDDADIYTPLGQDTTPFLQRRGPHPIHVVARLQPGVPLAQAREELGLFGRHLAAQYPNTNKDRTFFARQLHPDVGNVRSMLWLLLGAVSLILLIGCANIASLLLARAVSRERELSTRAALGAGRWRLIRQGLTESAVLACSGGMLGVVLARVGVRPFLTFWPGSLPRIDEVHVDWRVLMFALAVSLGSGITFGLVPALRQGTRDIEQRLRVGSRTVVSSSRRPHSVFVVCEIALALVLLVSAGMLGRSLLYLSSLNPGLDIHNVLVSRMALSPATLKDPGQIRAAWNEILERARAATGVSSVAMVDTVPMRSGDNELAYWMSPDVPKDENKLPAALATSVSPDYLKVMKIRLLKGRFFDERDRIGSPLVIVIDDVMARHAFGDSEAVGKQLWIPDIATQPVLVVGVVKHVRQWGLGADDQARIRDQVYYPFAQVPDSLLRRWSELMSIAVRTNGNPLSRVNVLRERLRGETGEQVLYEVRTMEQLARSSLERQRFLMLLFGVFAALALLLACIGVYGVLAYLTGQRVPELGLRMALGASASGIQSLILRQSLAMILVGIGIGVTGAIAAVRVLRRTVDGMQPAEPLTFVVILCVLITAALLASFLPARRASRIDPIAALRQD